MPPASATNEPDDQQQQQRADGGVDDCRDNARAEVEAELREEPTADEGTCDSDEEVADNPEPGALHDLARQPSGYETDHQYDQETFTRLCIFVSSSCISKLTNFRPRRRREIHHQRRAWPKVTIRFLKADWNHPLR
jgi:hypothetical protein